MAPIMENQAEADMEHEVATGFTSKNQGAFLRVPS